MKNESASPSRFYGNLGRSYLPSNTVFTLAICISILGMAFTFPEKSHCQTAESFSALKYRNVGPTRGGRSTAVVGVSNDPQTYYMGGVGGVWKTDDAGKSWQNVSDGFIKTSSVGDIDVCDTDPNFVVVGMGESPFRREMSSHGDGVYVSSDALLRA